MGEKRGWREIGNLRPLGLLVVKESKLVGEMRKVKGVGGKGRWEALHKLSKGDGWKGEMGGITQVKRREWVGRGDGRH